MSLIPPTIEAYQVQHLPIVKAYADKIGLLEVINQLVPTEMAVDPGTIVLGMIRDTLSGRRPLYRLEEFFPHQDTELLVGKTVAPEAFHDDTVGRVLDRLYEIGTMKLFTACAVRVDQVLGLDKRYGHFDTTSVSVYGDYLPPEDQQDQQEPAVPLTITHGYSKDKRPDLQQFVFSTLCVDRAVPLWGKPHDGNASDKTVHNTLLSGIATFLAPPGVAPGAYIYGADAALVTEENLRALGDTLFISRLPATYNACGRLIADGWTARARCRVVPCRPLRALQSSPCISAAPMRKLRRRSCELYTPGIIHWTSSLRNGPSMAGAGQGPPCRAPSTPCSLG